MEYSEPILVSSGYHNKTQVSNIFPIPSKKHFWLLIFLCEVRGVVLANHIIIIIWNFCIIFVATSCSWSPDNHWQLTLIQIHTDGSRSLVLSSLEISLTDSFNISYQCCYTDWHSSRTTSLKSSLSGANFNTSKCRCKNCTDILSI